MTAAKVVWAPWVPNRSEALNAARSDGLSRALDRLIAPCSRCSSRPGLQREGASPVTLSSLGGDCGGDPLGCNLVGKRRRG